LKLYCKICNIPISKEVEELGEIPKNHISENSKEDYIPVGKYFIVKDDLDPIVLPKGNYVLNLKDVINTKYHPNRIDGCCGIAGSEKPNVLCKNSHEIGTEYSDCWCSWYIHIDFNNVTKKYNFFL